MRWATLRFAFWTRQRCSPSCVTRLRKSDIDQRVASRISPMPQGLVNVLTKDEILRPAREDPRAAGGVFVQVSGLLRELSGGRSIG